MAPLLPSDRWLHTALVVLCLIATGPFHELLHGQTMPSTGQLEWHRSDCDHLPTASAEGECGFLLATRSPWTLDRPGPSGLSPLKPALRLVPPQRVGHPTRLDPHRSGARAPPRIS